MTDTAVEATRVLVVEDEEAIQEFIVECLKPEGYSVQAVSDGQEALKAFFGWQPNLVLLDIMLPKLDGWALLERFREVSDVPVVILTALGQEREKVRGLKGGADDYLTKPIGYAELLARVEAVLRRSKAVANEVSDTYKDGALHIDYRRHQVFVRGREIALSAQEFRVLASLVSHAGSVLSSEQLLDLSWGDDYRGPEIVRVYIGYLRKKLEDDPSRPSLIETVREFGYRYRAS
jgi:DNA-binding response OmpR family regulator